MTPAGTFHDAWHRLPIAEAETIIGDGTCLILAPHPDDESLGCGGLIATLCAAGRPPIVAVLTDGAGSHPNSLSFPPPRLRAQRAQEVREAVAILGLPPERVVFLNQPDTAAPMGGRALDAVVDRLDAILDNPSGCCTALLAPWRHDPHCDHLAAAITAEAVVARTGIRHIAYPVWGWTLPPDALVQSAPEHGWRLDIGAFLPLKRRAIHAHRSQYGGLITDDPTGFTLPPALLAVFETQFETFLLP